MDHRRVEPTDERHMAPAPPPQIGIERSGPRNVWSKPGWAPRGQDGQVRLGAVWNRVMADPRQNLSDIPTTGWVSDMFMGCRTTAENTCSYVTITCKFIHVSI